MNNRALSTFGLRTLIPLLIAVVCSCDREESATATSHFFHEAISQKNYSLDDQVQLNELSKVLAKESGVLEIMKDAAVVTLTDSEGVYKAISVQYRVRDVVTKLIVPLAAMSPPKAKDTGNIGLYYVAEPCEMKCTSSAGCGTCTQEIIERCKSQKCTCSLVGGECTGSVSFPN